MSINSNTDEIVKNILRQGDGLVERVLNSGYVKSQHELNPCNDGKRSSDVLVETISKLETTTKQLEIAKKALNKYAYGQIQDIQEGIDGEDIPVTYPYSNDDGEVAKTALKQIEELNK